MTNSVVRCFSRVSQVRKKISLRLRVCRDRPAVVAQIACCTGGVQSASGAERSGKPAVVAYAVDLRECHGQRAAGFPRSAQAVTNCTLSTNASSQGLMAPSGGAGTPARIAALAEILAMLALVLSYIWLWQQLFPGDRVLVVFLYFALCHFSHVRRGESARSVGLRLDNWRSAARQASVPLAVAVAVPLAIGAALGTWHFEPASLPLDVPWHVAWGTAQQYGLLCFLYRRSLDVLSSWRGAALTAAAVFALFHLPNPLLVPVTFLAGFVACTLYRRVPNVFVLGAAHAVISLVLFYALPLSITHELRVGPGYYTAATEPAYGD